MALMLDHERAKSAYAKVNRFIGSGGDNEKFKSWALKFPSMILNCGLLQSISLCQEKSSEVYEIAAEWLVDRGFFQATIPLEKVSENVSKMGLNEYRHANREMIAYMTWVKRATSILMPD